MKTIMTSALLGLLLSTAASADTFVFQGCEMKQIEGSNAYTSVVPGCITAQDGSKGTGGTPAKERAEAEAPGEGEVKGS